MFMTFNSNLGIGFIFHLEVLIGIDSSLGFGLLMWAAKALETPRSNVLLFGNFNTNIMG